MSEINPVTEIGESKEKNFAEVLKLAISHATFENKDIGGYVYALIDSLASDQIYTEFEESETTISIMSDLVNAIREDLDEVAGRIEEDDDDDDDDEDEIQSLTELRTIGDLEDDDDDDEDEDDLPEELGEVDEDDDDEIMPGVPGENVDKKDESV